MGAATHTRSIAERCLSTWQGLRKASVNAGDSAFASHLLSLELRRRERFTKTTTGGPKQKAAAIREPQTSTPVGKHHNKMADPEISLSEAGSDQGDKYEAYKARKQLSAIDWNFHQDGLPPASNEKVTRQGVCEPNPCKNQGTCKETGDEEDPYECDCLPEWKGDNCEYYVDDPCFPNPCLNGGKCKHGTMNETFRCICPKGFEGLNCEKSMTNGNPWVRTFPNAKIVKLAKKYRAKTHYYYKNGELAKRSTGCECHNGNCGCCLHIQFLNIDDDVCLNSTFDANRLKRRNKKGFSIKPLPYYRSSIWSYIRPCITTRVVEGRRNKNRDSAKSQNKQYLREARGA
ncbi:predicted protein [Nematostella vectensis]|uniref:EGF-like domain-containing protein n=1 Tax=Nematostella vectensis TaxID=45351 RepID=A7SS38_NEMVE|nr:predicted protein [Nematostella vectensis]|eukprot:XP_001625589.1 predicted protein [Nematostella vectensis]